MATARERLLQALHAIISRPYTDDGKGALKRLLNSYRVQAKPGETIEKEQTARDVLADQIIKAWVSKSSLEKKQVAALIAQFRMQVKHGLSRSELDEDHPELEAKQVGGREILVQSARLKSKENISRHQNAYFKDKNGKNTGPLESSIAGGPLPKSQGRGQCPKCRSMGIVLARSYGGDDHYSCIYCGYQAYLKAFDAKLDLPRAAELLDQSFGEPKLEPDE